MSTDNTCPRCGGVRIYRKCLHGCDGKTPDDVRKERRSAGKRKDVCKDSSCTGGWSEIGGEKQTCCLDKNHKGPHRSRRGVCWASGDVL